MVTVVVWTVAEPGFKSQFGHLSIVGMVSLHFNSHFLGRPRLASPNVSILDFTGAKDDGCSDTGATRRAKIQSNRHHQQTNTQCFTGQMPFLLPNQQCHVCYRQDTYGSPMSSLNCDRGYQSQI